MLPFPNQATHSAHVSRGLLTIRRCEVQISLTCRVDSVYSCRTLRPGLEKLAWPFPLDLCHCAVTGTSETFDNAALNSGARMTCFSERKGGQHYYVSRGSWHDLIHEPFFCLCQGIRLCRTASRTWLSATFSSFLTFAFSLEWNVKYRQDSAFSVYLPHNSQEEQG